MPLGLSYKTSTAQLVGPDTVVVTERAAFFAHHHRFQGARARGIAHFLLENQLRLHRSTRMVDHEVVTAADYRVVMHGTFDADVSIDHTLDKKLYVKKYKKNQIAFKNKYTYNFSTLLYGILPLGKIYNTFYNKNSTS